MNVSLEITSTKPTTPACHAHLHIAKHVWLPLLILLLTNASIALLPLNFHRLMPAPNALRDTFTNLLPSHVLSVTLLAKSVRM